MTSLQIRAAAELELRRRKRALPDSRLPMPDFTAFKRSVWPEYLHADHLELIDRKLEAVESFVRTGKGIKNLMIMIPPRHGKSYSVARFFPAWFLGRNPDKRILMASYGASLITQHSRFVRNLMRSDAYLRAFPGIRLADDSAAKHSMDIEGHSGGLEAVGKQGAVTGKGGHLLIVDDIVKNRAEAESQLQRDNDWAWLQEDYFSRREPNAATVVIGTRWHLDDAQGRLVTEQGDQWEIIRLPALAEKDDALGREEGSALWPERYPAHELIATRSNMGDYAFSALYQQDPVSSEGGIFKREKLSESVIEAAPANITDKVRYWDLAMSSKTHADYTVGVLAGKTATGQIVVLDVQRFQAEWDDVLKRIAGVAQMDGRSVRIGIETAFYQSRAVKNLLERPELFQFAVKGYTVDTDKLTRALPVAARAGEGLLYLTRGAWLWPFIDELSAFPHGAHDDQVDALSGAYTMLDTRKALTVSVQKYA